MCDVKSGAVQLRSFDMYLYHVSDPTEFFKEVSGAAAQYSSVGLEDQLRNTAVTQLTVTFGSSGIPSLDMTASQVLLSQEVGKLLGAKFAKLGLALGNFTVESISLPASVQAALDRKISMGVIGDLGRYTQYQTAKSVLLATQNKGGLIGIGAGLGVGAGIGQAMTGAMFGIMQPNVQQAQQNAQPVAEDPQAKLVKLKSSLGSGLISQEDFDKAEAEVLKQLIG